MALKIEEITEGVFHVKTKSQYDISSPFMRLQEFYESPFKEIRGHFFTHEDFMDVYAHNPTERSGNKAPVFSYFEDWSGFNVPGHVFDRWVKLFEHDLWSKEETLIDLVYDKVEEDSKFYVIGTYDSGDATIDHELSHAWFYLDPKYKAATLKLVRSLPKTTVSQLRTHLLKNGYTASVVNDEIIAYLSSNTMPETVKMFKGKKVPWEKVYEFQKLFWDTKDEKIDED